MGVIMGSSSTFLEVAEDHVRTLVASGRSEQDAAKELGTLAASLDAEGQADFARALRIVSRRHENPAPRAPLAPVTAASEAINAS